MLLKCSIYSYATRQYLKPCSKSNGRCQISRKKIQNSFLRFEAGSKLVTACLLLVNLLVTRVKFLLYDSYLYRYCSGLSSSWRSSKGAFFTSAKKSEILSSWMNYALVYICSPYKVLQWWSYYFQLPQKTPKKVSSIVVYFEDRGKPSLQFWSLTFLPWKPLKYSRLCSKI